MEDKLEKFLEAVTAEQPNPTAEQPETENPTMARTAKSRPSEPSSGSRSPRGDVGVSEREASRPSVREELREIRREQRQKSPETDRERVHIPARIKKDEPLMAEEKVVVTLDNFEQRLMVSGLADFRNDLIRDEKPTEDVDELILKVIDAPTEKARKKADRAAR